MHQRARPCASVRAHASFTMTNYCSAVQVIFSVILLASHTHSVTSGVLGPGVYKSEYVMNFA